MANEYLKQGDLYALNQFTPEEAADNAAFESSDLVRDQLLREISKERNPANRALLQQEYDKQFGGGAGDYEPGAYGSAPVRGKKSRTFDDALPDDLFSVQAAAPAAQKDKSFFGHMGTGAKTAFQQLPQLGYGVAAFGASALESALGEGGLATAAKKWAVGGYQEWGAKIQKDASENYEFDKAYDKAKNGDFGALVDWLGYGIGYAVGQGVQMVGTAGVGSLAGRAALKPMAEKMAAGMVEKEMAKGVTREVAVANAASQLGQNAALGAAAFGMEGGEIGGDLASKTISKDGANRALSGGELAQAFGATLLAGSLEFAGDKLGLSALEGKVGKGINSRVGRGLAAGAVTGAGEFGTEYTQTIAEEWGKGNDSLIPEKAETYRQALNAGALGAVGGHVMGGVGGILSANSADDAIKAAEAGVDQALGEHLDTSVASAQADLESLQRGIADLRQMDVGVPAMADRLREQGVDMSQDIPFSATEKPAPFSLAGAQAEQSGIPFYSGRMAAPDLSIQGNGTFSDQVQLADLIEAERANRDLRLAELIASQNKTRQETRNAQSEQALAGDAAQDEIATSQYANNTDRELEVMAKLTRSEEKRAAIQQEQERRATQPAIEQQQEAPQPAKQDREAMAQQANDAMPTVQRSKGHIGFIKATPESPVVQELIARDDGRLGITDVGKSIDGATGNRFSRSMMHDTPENRQRLMNELGVVKVKQQKTSPVTTEQPKADHPFSLGTLPTNAEPITVRNGVVHVGEYPAQNFETGEDVTVQEGASHAQIRKALEKAGAVPRGARFFGEEKAAVLSRMTALGDERAARYADDLRKMAEDVGWQEHGGRLLRDEKHNVIGRTRWIPYAEWFMSGMIPTPAAAKAAVEKAIAGEAMSAKEKRTVQQMMDWLDNVNSQPAEQKALDEMGYDEMPIAEQDVVDTLGDLDIDAPNGVNDVAAQMRSLGFTEDEINAELKQENSRQGSQADDVGSQVATEANVSERAETGESETGRPNGEAFALETQDDKDLAAKEQREHADQGITKEQIDRESAHFTLSGQSQANPKQAPTGGQGWLFRADGSASAAAKIADFGEKIGGARKDVWQSYKDSLGEVSDADIIAEPLSKSWPQPDYQKLLSEGADPWVVGYMRAARDEIPRKPTAKWKQKTWAAQVQMLRDVTMKLLDGTYSVERAKALMEEHVKKSRNMERIASRIELYQLVGHEKSLAGVSFAEHYYSLYKGKENVRMWAVEQDAKASAFSNWPRELATGSTKEEALRAFKEKLSTLNINETKKNATTFEVYSRRGENGYWIGKKLGRNPIMLEGPFKTVLEARTYKAENHDKLVEKLEKSKEIPKTRRDTNNPRVGEDMRNGQDVTPKMFEEAFGFRGVEFGNWVEQKKRQQDLNNAFDALMDMAAILDVPPRALSLDGQLGLAFGARGTGGIDAAAAHYEPAKVVINLTKKEGAGSLGHEWWHALDNYFQRARGKGEYATEALDVSLAARGSEFVANTSMRKEMVEAFGDVVRAINATQIKARSRKLDSKRSKEYWITGREMSARAFESYLISKLQDQNASNDYLANIVDEETWAAAEKLGFELDQSYPYPTAGEIPAIRAGFDKFFQTIETKETDKGVAFYSNARALTPADNVETKDLTADELPSAKEAADGQMSRTEAMALNVMARLLGKKIVFRQGLAGDGMVVDASTIYLNPDNWNGVNAVSVFGHEFWHQLKMSHREVWDAVAEKMRPYMTDAAMVDQFNDYFAQSEKFSQWSEEQIKEALDKEFTDEQGHEHESLRSFLEEEMLSDLAGNRFAESEFWSDVFGKLSEKEGQQKAKTLIERFVKSLNDMLTKLLTFMKAQAGFKADNALAEHITSVRDAMSDGMAQYLHETEYGNNGVQAKSSVDKNSFNRADPETKAFVNDFLRELSFEDEAFRYAISKSKTLEGNILDALPGAEYLGEDTRPDEREESQADHRYVFAMPDEKIFYVYSRGKDYWIDVSRLQRGDQGSAVYHGVANFAYNTGNKFIGDPNGLSDDAIIRRTSAMLSSALRFGTTEHIEAAREQINGDPENGIEPLDWRGDDIAKTNALIHTYLVTLQNKYPEIKNWRYDFATGKFETSSAVRDGNDGGSELGQEASEAVDGRGLPGLASEARAGVASLRRGILLESLVSSESSERPELLEYVLSRSSQLVSQKGGLREVFSTQRASRNELSDELASNRTIDRAELAALRRAAADLERPQDGIFLRVTEDGRAIATGQKGQRIPDSFRRFAEDNDLTFSAERRLPKYDRTTLPSNNGDVTPRTQPMPIKYRADGAMYFGEMGGEALDRTGMTRFSTQRLAPNGKLSNLPENLYYAVRTPQFKAWFGDWEKYATKQGGVWNDDKGEVSKVVDDNGEPMVVYHGTQQGGFTRMAPEKGDKHRGPMVFAAADRNVARTYSGLGDEISFELDQQWLDALADEYHNKLFAELSKEDQQEIEKELLDERVQSGIYSLFLNIRNPYESDFEGANWDGQRFDSYEVVDEDGETQYDDQGRGVFSEDDAIALAESLGEGYEARQAPDHYETTNSVAEEARQYGHDGAIIRQVVDDGGKYGVADATDVFVFFDSNQAKSATQNNGEYSRTNDDIRYSTKREETPVFYSQLARQVEAAPERMFSTAPQFKAWLSSNAAKLGIKKDEIQWSGINEYLDTLGKGKVSKADVLGYLQQNGVQVKEVMRNDGDAEAAIRKASALGRQFRDAEEALINAEDLASISRAHAERIPSLKEKVESLREAYFAAKKEAEEADAKQVQTRYSQYVLPGGDNYRELLLTLPEVKTSKPFEQWTKENFDGSDTEHARKIYAMQQEPGKNFTSSHWNEPNILAHIRFNTRTDADGAKVLFIEEIQSDWGQKGKKEGFGRKPDRSELAAAAAGNGFWYVYPKSRSEEAAPYIGKRIEANTADQAIDKAHVFTIGRNEKGEFLGGSHTPAAPFVTDTKSWVALALKRMMRYAADNGFEKIAFVTGDQSAERYDLSKQISSIDSSKTTQGKYAIRAKDHSNNVVVDDVYSADKLEDVVGKELAKRIVDETPEGSVPGRAYAKTFSGLDLKVGGEGMKSFYNQIVPQVVNDVLKKVGGGRVESIRFNDFESKNGASDDKLLSDLGVEVNGTRPAGQPGFTITPEMREKVSGEGLPLFSRARGWDNFPDAVIGHRSVQQSEHYAAAKDGDLEAAIKLARLFVTPDYVAKIKKAIGDKRVIFAPVRSAEQEGSANAIPEAVAGVLADRTGGVLDEGSIRQQERIGRGGSDGWGRIANQPKFRGEVVPGADYVIVDDTLTQGGTLAQLKEYIENNGGNVVLATTLTGKQYSAKIGLSQPTLSALREKLGSIEPWFRESFGFGFEGLTESEARYLVSARGLSPDAIRGRIAAAMREGADGDSQSADRQQLPLSKESPSRSIASTMTAAQQAADARVFGTPKTAMQRFNEFKQNWQKHLAQGIFDQYMPLQELDPKAYVMARLAKGGDSTLEALLMYGKVYVDQDGFYRVDYNEKQGMNGFAKVLQGLDGEHDRFFKWVAALRADKLKAIGLENLMSQQDINALKSLDQGDLQNGQKRKQAYAKALQGLNEFNDSVLKIAVDSGLIDDATRQMYKDTPYVPFYRLSEEEIVQGPIASKGIVNQYAWKKLKGGTDKLNEDLMANMLQNWSHMITASANNRAAKQALDAAVKSGAAIQIPNGAPGKGHVRYTENGVEKTFDVTDPFLMDAIASIGFQQRVWKPLADFKKYLTIGVTINPTFKIRNLIRDSVQAIGTADLSYNPVENILAGAKATKMMSDVRAQMLASGGMIRFGTAESRSDFTREMVEKGIDKAHILDNAGAIKRFWKHNLKPAFDAYQELGDRGENINRAALYERLVAKGMSHGEASFWARDLMDFSMSGKWQAVRVLCSVVPFMNARLQGLYKLGRATKQDYRRMAATLGAVTMASLALMLAYRDDDDWKKREDWDRDNSWWFKVGDTAFRIPKPFEIGAIASIAERGLELMIDDEMTPKRFGGRMADIISNQLSMNPTPQLVKPLIDLWANKDSFTGRPIENMGMERLRKEDRYGANTSETAKLLVKMGLPNPAQLMMGKWDALSPAQIDFMIRGYFSWLGTAATTTLDYGLRPMVSNGEKPDMRLKDVFLAGNFVESLPSGSSRYVSHMYDQAKEIEQMYASYRQAMKEGDTEKAREIATDHAGELSKYHQVEALKKRESEISSRIKQVQRSESLSGETKRRMIDMLEQQRDQVARAFK